MISGRVLVVIEYEGRLYVVGLEVGFNGKNKGFPLRYKVKEVIGK